MGLDIAFSRGWEWSRRPGWKFGEKVVEAAEVNENGVGTISLAEISEAYEEWTATNPTDDHELQMAANFIAWCNKWWKAHNYSPTDNLTILISY